MKTKQAKKEPKKGWRVWVVSNYSSMFGSHCWTFEDAVELRKKFLKEGWNGTLDKIIYHIPPHAITCVYIKEEL